MEQAPSHFNVPPLSPHVLNNPKYVPDPVLQKYDPLPQPYRMICRIVDDLFSNVFEGIDQLERRNLKEDNTNEIKKKGALLNQSALKNDGIPTLQLRSRTLHKNNSTTPHVVRSRNNQLKEQHPIFSNTKFGVDDAVCVGTSKVPIVRSDHVQVSSKDIWLLLSKHEKDVYILRREKVIWRYKDYIETENGKTCIMKEDDFSDVRCLAKDISVFGTVASDQTINFWIYIESEDMSRPDLNYLCQIKNKSGCKVSNLFISNDARYTVVDYVTESDEHIISAFKLPSYKKFVGDVLHTPRPKSTVSVTTTSTRKGGRRVLASTASTMSSLQRRNVENISKPKPQPDKWDTEKFTEVQEILSLSKTDYLKVFSTNENPWEDYADTITTPNVCFISNSTLIKQASTTNSIFKLYDENFIRACQTRAIIVWWGNANILKVYDIDRYYEETRTLPESNSKTYTLVSGISCITTSEEGDMFAVGLTNGNIIIFDTNNFSSTYLQSGPSAVSALSFTTYGDVIVGSRNGEIFVFSHQESSTVQYVLNTHIQSYKNSDDTQCILALIPAKDSNLFWCCTSKHVDVLDTMGSTLCTIPLQNISCFRFMGSFENILITSSHCIMDESHGFCVYEMLDAILQAYPEVENHFPSIHNAESAVSEVFQFVRCTPHALRNDPTTISNYLITPSFLLPLMNSNTMRPRTISSEARPKRSQQSLRPKSKGVSFGEVNEDYITLGSLGQQSKIRNPIQRTTLRVQQTQRARKQRIRQATTVL